MNCFRGFRKQLANHASHVCVKFAASPAKTEPVFDPAAIESTPTSLRATAQNSVYDSFSRGASGHARCST